MGYYIKFPPVSPVSQKKNPAMVSPSLAGAGTTGTTGTPTHESDPFPALLDFRVSEIRAPLEVRSTILGETIWMVANDQQAAEVQAKGGVAYSPEEVAILKELAATVPPAVWADRLKLIHRAKVEFQGWVEGYEPPPWL